MLKYPVALGAFILVGVAAWWAFVVVPQSQEPLETPEPFATATDSLSQWQWVFDPAGEDPETQAPRTSVVLLNGDTSYAIGTFTGSCFDIMRSDWELLTAEGELAGAICWWAGGGTEIGVFSNGGSAIVRIGDVEEGTAEGGGMRGNWRDLFEIRFGFVPRLTLGTITTIAFDDALWLIGEAGENVAIEAGLCTEATRAECFPNGFYIYNETTSREELPLASNLAIYMVTWHMEKSGVKREYIRLDDFARLINDANAHWQKLPYNVTVRDGEVIIIEEVYVP